MTSSWRRTALLRMGAYGQSHPSSSVSLTTSFNLGKNGGIKNLLTSKGGAMKAPPLGTRPASRVHVDLTSTWVDRTVRTCGEATSPGVN